MAKELRIDLNYLAKTYGIEMLEDAEVECGEHGDCTLVLKGSKATTI